jgi:hypothetical protein
MNVEGNEHLQKLKSHRDKNSESFSTKVAETFEITLYMYIATYLYEGQLCNLRKKYMVAQFVLLCILCSLM